jgi:hypothetical protein
MDRSSRFAQLEDKMATTATIPVNVSAEAAARIVGLGMQREFEEMIEHAKQVLPGARWIHVTLEDSPEEPGDLRVVAWVHRPPPANADFDTADWDYAGWFVNAFPPEVCQHFCIISTYGGDDGWPGISP